VRKESRKPGAVLGLVHAGAQSVGVGPHEFGGDTRVVSFLKSIHAYPVATPISDFQIPLEMALAQYRRFLV
jgi:hypothetical protein